MGGEGQETLHSMSKTQHRWVQVHQKLHHCRSSRHEWRSSGKIESVHLNVKLWVNYYKDIGVWCGSSDSKNTGVRSSVTLNNGSIPMARVQLGRNIKVTYLKNLFPPLIFY